MAVSAIAIMGTVLAWQAAPVAHAGSIVGSLHDLSRTWDAHYNARQYGNMSFNDYGQVCVYCHTPHNASPAQPALWNRPETGVTYQMYTSSTMDNVPGQPGASSRLCLSCHDGTIAVDAVLNVPKSSSVTVSPVHLRMSTEPGQCIDCHGSGCDTSCHGFWNFTNSFLGTNLGNEHPIAVPYPATPEFVPAPAGGKFPNGVQLVNGRIECVSCHNVHDPAIRPFLRTPNNASSLCFTCHAK